MIGQTACTLTREFGTRKLTQTEALEYIDNVIVTDSLGHFCDTHLTRLLNHARHRNFTVVTRIRKHLITHSNAAGRCIDQGIKIELTAFEGGYEGQGLYR